MLDNYEWIILPVFNVDGYEYTHTNVCKHSPYISYSACWEHLMKYQPLVTPPGDGELFRGKFQRKTYLAYGSCAWSTCGSQIKLKLSPVPELSFLPAPYRG